MRGWTFFSKCVYRERLLLDCRDVIYLDYKETLWFYDTVGEKWMNLEKLGETEVKYTYNLTHIVT